MSILIKAAAAGLRQRFEQCFGVLKIGGVESLGEPIVDWLEQLEGLPALSHIAPESSEAGRRAQLPRAGALLAGDLQSAMEAIALDLMVDIKLAPDDE